MPHRAKLHLGHVLTRYKAVYAARAQIALAPHQPSLAHASIQFVASVSAESPSGVLYLIQLLLMVLIQHAHCASQSWKLRAKHATYSVMGKVIS